MYHIILIDDERIAIEGLYEVVTEEFQECKILKAESGEEALKLFGEYRIDIAVIDINMPGISGLELQSIVKEKWPRCKNIFLTGYDRSDYIRQAMRSGSSDYILKLEGDEAVLEAIKVNLQKLKDEEKRTLEKARMNQMMKIKEKKIKELLLHKILSEPVKDEQQIVNTCKEERIEVDFTKPVWMLAGKILEESGTACTTDEIEVLSEIFQELVIADCRMECIIEADQIVIWLFQPEQNAEMENLYLLQLDKLRNKIWKYLELVEEAVYEELGRNAAFLGMWRKSAVSDIYADYRYIKMAFLQYDFEKQGNMILLREDIIQMDQKVIAKQETDIFPTLCDCIEGGLRRETYTIFLQSLRQRGDASQITQRPFYECALLLYKLIDKYHLREQMEGEYNLNKLLEFHDFENEFDMEYYFAEILHKIFQLLEMQGNLQNDKLLLAVNSYIHAHIRDDLSIHVLAEQVHLHPSYLSRLYKKKMGTSITNYIAQVKVNRAKNLLVETDMKIWEIADKTGFASAGYFSRFFSKEFSMTPQEYRNKYRR